MPIRDDVLYRRLVASVDSLSLCVQAGIELDNATIKRVHDVVNHVCMPSGFVGQNEDYFKEVINLLLEYIEMLQRPHALIKTAKASPCLVERWKQGLVPQVWLVSPKSSVTMCYDDNEVLKYYSITKEATPA